MFQDIIKFKDKKTIMDFLKKKEHTGLLILQEQSMRDNLIINSDLIRKLDRDYMFFENGKWVQHSREYLIDELKSFIINSKREFIYNESMLSRIADVVRAEIESFPLITEIIKLRADDKSRIITNKEVIKFYFDVIQKDENGDPLERKLIIEKEENKGQEFNSVSIPSEIEICIEDIDIDSFEIENEEMNKFMRDITCNDDEMYKVLQEIAGHTTIFGFIEPFLYFFLGSGANGKSVFADMLGILLGQENLSNIQFHKLNDQNVSALETCLLNLPTEMPENKNIPEDTMKAIVDGEGIASNSKYLQPRTVYPISKHITLANTLPHIKDGTDGFWRRSIVVPFDLKMKKDSKGKKSKRYFEKLFMDNAELLRKWAIVGAIRLKYNGGYHTECKRINGASQEFKNDNNLSTTFLNYFIEEYLYPMVESNEEVFERRDSSCSKGNYSFTLIAKEGEVSIDIQSIFFVYGSYCDDYGYKKMNLKNLKKQLLNALITGNDVKTVFEIRKSNGSVKLFFDLGGVYSSKLKDK